MTAGLAEEQLLHFTVYNFCGVFPTEVAIYVEPQKNGKHCCLLVNSLIKIEYYEVCVARPPNKKAAHTLSTVQKRPIEVNYNHCPRQITNDGLKIIEHNVLQKKPSGMSLPISAERCQNKKIDILGFFETFSIRAFGASPRSAGAGLY
jgi:hypothetical protein